MNVTNLVFRQIELAGAGRAVELAEVSACKLYCAQAVLSDWGLDDAAIAQLMAAQAVR